MPVTAEMPKCLVPLGDKPLIEYSLEALVANGISGITIVTGYQAEKLDYLVDKYPEAGIELVFNPRYATANNIYSLWVVKDRILDGFRLLNSDIIYHPEILARSVASEQTHIVLDDVKDLAEEEMKVYLQSGQLTRISKLLDPGTSAGEYIGIMAFGAERAKTMVETMDSMIESDELDCFYEHVIDKLCVENAVSFVSTEGMPWTEIDTHEDLAYAREEILPGVLQGIQSQAKV